MKYSNKAGELIAAYKALVKNGTKAAVKTPKTGHLTNRKIMSSTNKPDVRDPLLRDLNNAAS